MRVTWETVDTCERHVTDLPGADVSAPSVVIADLVAGEHWGDSSRGHHVRILHREA